MENTIKIRTHHLCCIPRFYSGGYDKNFAENMKNICLGIRKNPNIKINICIGQLDNLCMQCPHQCKDRCVQLEKMGQWVVAQDQKVAKLLNIKPNSIHTAKDIFNLAMDKINEQTIRSVCKGCVFWNNCIKVGINNSFRKDLNAKNA